MRNDLLPPPPPDILCKALELDGVTIDWLAGDGSDRCYYRIRSSEIEETYVLMQLSESDAKLLQQNGYDWVHIGELLERYDVRVPRLRKPLPEYASLIIEDYGDWMLESEVLLRAENKEEIESIYHNSFSILDSFLKIPRDQDAVWTTRSFDKERFEWELHFFVRKFLEPVAGLTLSRDEQNQFEKEVGLLSSELADQSNYFVHRDFHSRNLMMRSNELAVIDFQDARLGPPLYDLVSLVFDSYVPLSTAVRLKLMKSGIDHLKKHLTAAEIDLWPATLLQRQLKAIGSFGYLTLEKGRGDYLKYVNPALEMLLSIPEVKDERWPFISNDLLVRMKTAGMRDV